MLNWQHRLWMTIRELLKHRQNMTKTLNLAEFEKHEAKIWDSRNFLTATTTFHFKYTHKLSVGISRLQSLTSVLRVRLTNYKTFHVDTFNNCDFILIQVTQKGLEGASKMYLVCQRRQLQSMLLNCCYTPRC